MAVKKVSSSPSKGNNSQSLPVKKTDVATKMAALEAKVEQLELQVAKLQGQLQEHNRSLKTSVSPQSKVAVAATSKKQKVKSPVKATAPKENTKPQDGSKKEGHDGPTKMLDQPQKDNMLIDITPNIEDVQVAPSPVSPSAYKKANIASACAFVRVTGPMGSCEEGTISTALDHFAAVQLDIDSETGALWISSSLIEEPKKGLSAKAQVADPDFLEMGAVFRSAQIVPESLQLERVVDTLVLPPAILDQLDDPNEVPTNLYYLTWKYHGCGADGFAQFQTMEADFDQKDGIMQIYRHVLGHRQTVQVWFITDAEHVEENLNGLKARCYREVARDWQPCSGHAGKQGEYCPLMGKNRKGVVQFLQQSAPPPAAVRTGTLQNTNVQKI